MTRNQKYFSAGFSVLFGLAVFLFFGIQYPYHIHFQEQYQLFEWTAAYFTGLVCAPGGFADWAGRFLTQFFYFAWAGAAVIALLLLAVQQLVFFLGKEKNFVTYALSFLPSLVLLACFCDENIMPGAAVALVLSQLASLLVLKVKCPRCRVALEIIGVPVMYWLAGPIALLFVGVVLRSENKRWLDIVLVVLFAASLFVSQYLCAYPLARLCRGVHYHRFQNICAWGVYASALICVLLHCLASIDWHEVRMKTCWFVGAGVAGIVASLVPAVILTFANFRMEEQMKYDFYLRMKMYNTLMMDADRKQPTTPFTVMCLNVALAHSDRMSNNMFEYFQNGTDGLLPEFKREYVTPLAMAEAYWEMGMVNTAQRMVFEAQESIPDYQKSARCYQRLAQTNIVNGDYAVARKYLLALENTLFYRKWAASNMALLEDEAAVAAHPEYGLKRALRLHDHDFFFSEPEMDSMLGLLFVENRDNRVAFDYLMAWCLLKKDLARFCQCLDIVSYPVLPKVYQEALVLQMALTLPDASGVPSYIDRRIVGGMEKFITDSRSGRDAAYMEKKYGKTYWFYYFYRNK